MASATLPDASTQELDAANSEVQQYAAIAAPIWPAYLTAACICLWFAWGTLPKLYLVAWMVLYGSFMIGRALTFRRYHALPQEQRIDEEALWRRRFTWIMFVYGTLQSLLIAVAIPWLPQGNSFLITWLIFFSGVLVTTVMPLSETNLRIYIGVTLVPTAFAWLFVDIPYAWLMSLALVMAAALFLKAGFARLATLRQTYTLATQLAESNALLRRSNVSRSRMIMEASHDLRQPAHALGMMVERLRFAVPGADLDRRVREIESGINSLSDMLNELMEFSRLDLGGYVAQRVPLDLRAVMRELDERFCAVAQSKGLGWSVALPDAAVWVDSDPWLLRRILNNLISNALKYTVHGQVQVGTEPGENAITVCVADTGSGIAPHLQDRVFAEYVRLQNSPTDEPGLGIGLAFARRAADALAHALTLRSEPGVGTELRLTIARLPVPDAAAAAAAEPATPEDWRGLRIVLLENDTRLRDSMTEVLQGWGASVTSFNRGDVAASQLLADSGDAPAAILADLHLDGSHSGLAAIRDIRQAFPAARIPAILLTGDLSGDVEREALAMGACVAYKPLRPSRLRALLQEQIQGQGRAAGAAASATATPSSMALSNRS